MPKAICMFCNEEMRYNPSQSFGKYCSNQCQQDYKYYNVTVPKILNGTIKDLRPVRRYIAETRGDVCSECNLPSMWNNKKLKLHMDHIDGNRKNNSLENLRLLCPNCHSQTDTYAGRNNGKGKNHNARKINDKDLKILLKKNENIHQALLEAEMAITGANYTRCKKLLKNAK